MNDDKIDDRIIAAKQGAKGGILNITSAIISKIGGLLFYILILRVITPAEGGIYFLSLAIASIIATIGILGIGDSLARFIPYYEGAKKQDKIKPLIFTALISFLIFSVLISFCVHTLNDIIITYYNKDIAPVLVITLFIGISLSFNAILLSALFGLRKFEECALYSAILPFLKLVLVTVLFLFSTKNVESALNATFWSIMIVNIAMFISIFIKLAKFSGRFGLLGYRDILETASYGIAAVLSQSSSVLMGYIDTIVLGYYASSNIIGAYNSIMNVARTAMHTISSQIFSVLTPMLTHMHGMESKIFKSLANNAVKWSVYTTIPLVIVVLFFAREIIEILFPAYADYYWLFYIIVPGIAIGIVSHPARSAISAVGRADLLFKSSFIGLVLNFILNLVLIPIYGVSGAAYATAFSYSINELIIIFYAYKFAKFEVPRIILKTIIPLISMLLVVILSYKHLFDFSLHGLLFEIIGVAFASSLSFLVYGILLIKLGGLNKIDCMIVEKLVKLVARFFKVRSNCILRPLKHL
ncbi:MAG: flippase [Candidatus Micrarchaeota archaeon]